MLKCWIVSRESQIISVCLVINFKMLFLEVNNVMSQRKQYVWCKGQYSESLKLFIFEEIYYHETIMNKRFYRQR